MIILETEVWKCKNGMSFIVHHLFVHLRISFSLSFQRKTKHYVFLLLFVLTPVHTNWPIYASGKCYRSPRQFISTMKHWWLYISIHLLTIFKWKMCNLRLNLIYLSFFVQYIYNYYSQNTVNLKVLFFEVSPIVLSNLININCQYICTFDLQVTWFITTCFCINMHRMQYSRAASFLYSRQNNYSAVNEFWAIRYFGHWGTYIRAIALLHMVLYGHQKLYSVNANQ